MGQCIGQEGTGATCVPPFDASVTYDGVLWLTRGGGSSWLREYAGGYGRVCVHVRLLGEGILRLSGGGGGGSEPTLCAPKMASSDFPDY